MCTIFRHIIVINHPFDAWSVADESIWAISDKPDKCVCVRVCVCMCVCVCVCLRTYGKNSDHSSISYLAVTVWVRVGLFGFRVSYIYI